MKRDKLLIIFILIVVSGIVLINFVFSKTFNDKQLTERAKLKLPSGYKEEVVLKGLKDPTSIAIDNNEDMYIAENIDGKGRIIKYTSDGKYTVLVKKTSAPITNIAFHKDELYISQKGAVSKLENGEIKDIITGLPSLGDYSNNGIAFGYDGMIYVCQGAATNSGVVGVDNYEKGWLSSNPYFHDYPPIDCVLGGTNFNSQNPLSLNKSSTAKTGAFLPFNTISLRSESIKGRLPGNACILRVTPFGTVEDTFAWGIRNPVGIVILPDTRVFASVQGMEDRGSRPIANGKDYLYELTKGAWLGWPDYEGGDPVVLKKFKSKNHRAPQFILDLHPNLNPPKPLASFNESGRIGVIDVCYNNSFGYKNNIFIPLKKGITEPAKIVTYDLRSKKINDFITNFEGSEQLVNPVQCSFSKNGSLFILENSKGILIKVTVDKGTEHKILPGSVPIEYFIAILILAFIIYLVFSVRRDKKPKQ